MGIVGWTEFNDVGVTSVASNSGAADPKAVGRLQGLIQKTFRLQVRHSARGRPGFIQLLG